MQRGRPLDVQQATAADQYARDGDHDAAPIGEFLFRRLLAVVCLIAAALIVVNAGLPDRARNLAIGYLPNGLPVAAEVGGVAPAPGASTFAGQSFSVQPGKPTIITFWATWCAPCLVELPALESLVQQARSQAFGLQVVAINLGESPDVVQGWLRDHGLMLPVALDPDQTAFRRYRVRGAPSTYFIDRTGVIRRIVYGALSPDGLDSGAELILTAK